MPPSTQTAVGRDADYEVVSWSEARAWWPTEPLLRAPSPPVGTSLNVYALSDAGGRKGSPSDKNSSVRAIYYPIALSPADNSEYAIVDGGGVSVQAVSSAGIDNLRQAPSTELTVRGVKGTRAQVGGSSFTYWKESGGWFLVWTSDTKYSESRIVELINSLTPAA